MLLKSAKRVKPKSATLRATPKPYGSPPRPAYALKQWTVEKRRNGWYIQPTTPSFAEKVPLQGPYTSLVSACLMIARQLQREAAKRYRQHCDWYGAGDS